MRVTKKSFLYLSVCVAALVLNNNAYATCSFNPTDLNFGSYQSPNQSADIYGSNSISIVCDTASVGTQLTISLSTGQSASFNRYLSNGKDKLSYNLYTTAGRTAVFGDGTSGTSTENIQLQTNTIINIFSLVPKEQNVSPGIYQDSIVYQLVF